jgi:two-component system, chemotaxis family, protein-glutamate methylesterase/glutaminase
MAIKVLIVEDSIMMQMIISEIVKSDSRFEVVATAANGKEGVDLAKQHRPDVILLDIEMPVMDGIECLKRLKMVGRFKVIILSSVAQVGSPQALKAKKLGAFDVLAKPSGAISLDLAAKKGHVIVQSMLKAMSRT